MCQINISLSMVIETIDSIVKINRENFDKFLSCQLYEGCEQIRKSAHSQIHGIKLIFITNSKITNLCNLAQSEIDSWPASQDKVMEAPVDKDVVFSPVGCCRDTCGPVVPAILAFPKSYRFYLESLTVFSSLSSCLLWLSCRPIRGNLRFS